MEGEGRSTSDLDLDMADRNTWKTILQLADMQHDHYGATRDLKYLDNAIANSRIALNLFKTSSQAASNVTAYMANLGSMLMDRYELKGNLDDLRNAVKETRAAWRLSRVGDPSYAHICYMLSMLLSNVYEQESSFSLLEESITLAEEAVSKAAKDENGLLAEFLANLSSRHLSYFDAKGGDSHLQRAIEVAEQAIEMTDEPREGLPHWINALGTALQRRFELAGDKIDIERAIDCSETAVRYSDGSLAQTYGFLSNLSSQLVRLYEATGDEKVLSRAVENVRDAYSAVPEEHIARGPTLVNLATTYRSLFNHTGDVRRLDEAIKIMEEALKALPDKHAEHLKALFSLGNFVMSKLERTGNEIFLRRASSYNHDALALCRATDRLWAKILLDASLLQYYDYEWGGDTEKLEQALRYISQALLHAKEGELDFAMMLSTQSTMFVRRFERTGRVEDLNEAIALERKAMDLTPKNNPNLPQRFNKLGVALTKAFERTEKIEFLKAAAAQFDEALRIPLVDPHPLVSLQVNRSNVYLLVFKKTGDSDYLDHALHAVESIDASILPGHPDQGKMMNNAALIMKERTKAGKASQEEIDKVIKLARQALANVGEGRADRAVVLKTLGDGLALSDALENQQQALRSYKDSLERKNGLPLVRLGAAQAYLETLVNILASSPDQDIDYHEAATISYDAVFLLSSINDRSFTRQDQQQILSRAAGLATAACSLALQVGKGADEAIDVLERGRALIIGYLIDRKSDVADLRTVDERLAVRFETLRDHASSSFQEIETETETDFRLRQSMHNQRLEAYSQLEEVIAEIREIPGMTRFLYGPNATERRKLAVNQAFVVVNITKLRSDALIVTFTSSRHFPLPKLRYNDVLSWIQKNITVHKNLQEFGRKNKLCLELLKWLWMTYVGPIIGNLAEENSSVGSSLEPLRICWIGTGLGSGLPFHAAGDHLSGAGDDALSRTLSSYTPTFKAFAEIVMKSGGNETVDYTNNLLLVSMPTTPGEVSLSKVTEEGAEIKARLEPRAKVDVLDHPSATEVLSKLAHYELAHFACHGVTDSTDPSKSHLKLQTRTGQPDPLTVQAISNIHLRRARIAFLSACSTADNPARRLADEVLHLASGFQVCGFQNVVATMWPTGDAVSVRFVSDFYRSLHELDGLNSDHAVARAVRKATMALRQWKLKQPLLWAQYVHWGV